MKYYKLRTGARPKIKRGIKEILEANFSNKKYIFTEKEPLDSSSKKVRHKNKNIIYFLILDSLL